MLITIIENPLWYKAIKALKIIAKKIIIPKIPSIKSNNIPPKIANKSLSNIDLKNQQNCTNLSIKY